MPRAGDPVIDSLAEPIRLRTLVLLRWVALAGQLCAVAGAVALGLRFNLGLVLAVMATAAAVNLVLTRKGRRPDGSQVAQQLGFDVVQVSILLALTGGLSNPFALLILAPVTIAATALDRQKVMLLGSGTVAMITLVALLATPLRDAAGAALTMPRLLLAGHWAAIVIAVAFFAAYAHRVASELRDRAVALTAAEMALAREQRLQHLGGVVAAAAHEMGTPLATIKLVSSELADELADREDLRGDLRLLAESADRCRDILRSMGRAGKDDALLRHAPLASLIDEAAAPHRGRRGTLQVTMDPGSEGPAPVVRRDPGVVHGLRNLIQNAVDFARSSVALRAAWSATELRVEIEDDGPGIPPALLARIGEPFLTTRRTEARAGYEGMGLGLFIAKTLLERSGATLRFGNGPVGARVEVVWPRARIEVDGRAALGANPEIA